MILGNGDRVTSRLGGCVLFFRVMLRQMPLKGVETAEFFRANSTKVRVQVTFGVSG